MDEAKRKEDMDIRDRLEELALRFPRYGYRRMTAQIKKSHEIDYPHSKTTGYSANFILT